MGALLGLLTSFSITTSEMFGRTVAKNIGPLVLTAATSLVGAVVAAGAAFVLGGDPTFGDMALGGISGVGFGFGMLSYFIGLNASSSAVVSPTVAALTTIIPFTWGAIARDVPPVLAFMGAIAAIVGLMFVTIGGDEASNVRHGLLWGLASGLGYGFGSAVLIEVAVDAGAWPAVSQRGFSLLLVIGR